MTATEMPVSAPAPDYPTAAPVSSDVNAQLGDIFSDVLNSEEEPEQPAAETSPEETPGGEAPTSPEAPATTEPSVPGGEGQNVGGYKLTEDGLSYLVPKAELPQLNGFKEYASQVQELFPTYGDAQTAAAESADLRAIHADYAHGSDQDLDAWLSHFAGGDYASDPALQNQFQRSFAKMVSRAPDFLKQVNPEAYEGFVGGLVGGKIEAAYRAYDQALEDAEMSQDPRDAEDAANLLKQAQYLEWGATGKVRGTYNRETGDYQYAPNKVDKAKQQQEQMEAQRKAVQDREDSLLKRDFESFQKFSLQGPKWEQLDAEIDKVLAPVKGSYNETVFNAVKDQVRKQTIDKLKADFDWSRNHENQYRAIKSSYEDLWKRNARTDGLQPQVAAYQNDFMARVRRILPSLTAQMVNKATASTVAAAKPAARAPRTQAKPTQATPATPAEQKPQGRVNIFEDPNFTKLFESYK